MFDLIPFGRNERNLFNYLDNVERSFWDGSISNMAQFRCDVQDKGDSYLLEAELPGFEREDIGIDLDGTTLVITARHSSESGERTKTATICAGSASSARSAAASTFRAWIRNTSAPHTKTVCWS